MALRMQIQSEIFGTFSDVDLSSVCAGQFRLSIGYPHPATLSWDMRAAQHTTPLPRLGFIRFWHEGRFLDDGSTAQSATAPLFEGYIEVVDPGGDSNQVNYTAMDPTYRVGRELTVMSLPWGVGFPLAVPPIPPTEAVGAIPRLVLNCKNDSDDDYAFERAHDGTVGNFIAGILEDAQEPLWWRNATPTHATNPNLSALAYVPADVNAMTFKPQEKLVWESETVRAGVARLERYEPRFRLLWHPGTRLWRWTNLTTAPTMTLTLNAPGVAHPVESLELQPFVDGCFSALKIYGPPTTRTEEFIWYNPDNAPAIPNPIPPGYTGYVGDTLAPSGQVILQTIGLDEIVSYNTWTIIDVTKRRGARLLPEWHQVEVGSFSDPKIPYEWLPVKKPTLLLTWDNVTWTACAGVWFNTNSGQAIFNGTSPYIHSTDQRGQGTGISGQAYFPPIGVKLIWAYYAEPLSVRVPATGFEGTAFTLAGLALEKKVYDESLAVGYEFGNPVTTITRRSQMELYARSQLDNEKDITWSGGAQVTGLDYGACRLNRRVNFAVADGSGGALVSGWEAMQAFLTDVEYDFEANKTTYAFSSNKLESIGEDPSQIKERLGIRALVQSIRAQQTNIFRTEFNLAGQQIQVLSGLNESLDYVYTDESTGNVTT